MKYGDKRDYRKIDIYHGAQYVGSTTWARTCREAKERYIEAKERYIEGAMIDPATIKASYAPS